MFIDTQASAYQAPPAAMPVYYYSAPTSDKKPKRKLHGMGDKNGGEKIRIQDRLQGFVPKLSRPWIEIQNRFGDNITHGELLSIAEVLAASARIFLDRDAKRRKSVLIKWFHENWLKIYPFLNYIILEKKPDS